MKKVILLLIFILIIYSVYSLDSAKESFALFTFTKTFSKYIDHKDIYASEITKDIYEISSYSFYLNSKISALNGKKIVVKIINNQKVVNPNLQENEFQIKDFSNILDKYQKKIYVQDTDIFFDISAILQYIKNIQRKLIKNENREVEIIVMDTVDGDKFILDARKKIQK